jgi:hypothetical protein
VVREPQEQAREALGKGAEHVQVHVPEILGAPGVVRVALHEGQLRIHGRDPGHGPPDLGHVRGPGGQEHGLALPGHVFQQLAPGDVPGADLEGRDQWGQKVHGLEVVWRGEEVDDADSSQRP